MHSPHFTRLGFSLLFAFFALSGWSQSDFEQAVFTTQQGDRIYVEIDAYSLQEALDSAFHFLNPDNSIEYNSWSDVLQNGSNPEMDLDLEGYDISNAGQITTNGTLTGDSLYLYKDGVVIGTFGVSGATSLASSLSVTGTVTFSNTLSVSGATTLSSTLDVTGNSTVGGTLGVTGATTLSNTLAVTGNADLDGTLDVDGTTELDGLNVDGITTADSLNASLGVDFDSTLHVDGNTDVDSNFDVEGRTTLDSTWVAEHLQFDGTDFDVNASDSVTVNGNTIDLDVTDAEISMSAEQIQIALPNSGHGNHSSEILLWDNATYSTIDMSADDFGLSAEIVWLNSENEFTVSAYFLDLYNRNHAQWISEQDMVIGTNDDGSWIDTRDQDDIDYDGDYSYIIFDAQEDYYNGMDILNNEGSELQLLASQDIYLNAGEESAEIEMSNADNAIALDADSVIVTGLFSARGTMDVDGAATLNSTLDVDGTTELDGLNVDGATTMDGTTMDGNLDLNGNADISGTATINDLDVTTNVDAATAAISGNATVGGTLGVTGNATLGADLSVAGDAYLDTALVAGHFQFDGPDVDVNASDAVTVDGNTIDLNVTDAELSMSTEQIDLALHADDGSGGWYSQILMQDDGDLSTIDMWADEIRLEVSGGLELSSYADTVTLSGATKIDGTMRMDGDLDLNGDAEVSGDLDVSAGTLTLAAGQIGADKVGGGYYPTSTYQHTASTLNYASTTMNLTAFAGFNTAAGTSMDIDGDLDVSGANLTLAAGQVGADKVGAGTFGAGTYSFSGSTISDLGTVTTADINGGTIDGATIATSDVTVGTGKTLDVSSGTLTLAAGQVTADKVGGGYYPTSTYQHTASTLNYASTTMNLTAFAGFNTAAGTSMDIDGDLDVSGANLTLAAGQVGADKVGAGTFGAGTYSFSGSTISDLGTVTTADINGGTISNATFDFATIGPNSYIYDTYINVTTAGYLYAYPGSSVNLSDAVLTLDDDQISGDAVNGGTIGEVTINQLNLASGAESPATRSTVLGQLIAAASSSDQAASAAPYNTGTYIDLPPGKWNVFINMQTDQGYNSFLTHGAGSGGGSIALGLSTSAAAYTPIASQFHTESLVGGSIDGDHSVYDMIQGTLLIDQSTGSTVRLYLWVKSIVDSSGSYSTSWSTWTKPASDLWDLNSLYAVPVHW